MSTKKDSALSSISALNSENYHLWADDMKPWLQLNGLWHLVSGQEKRPEAKPKVKDSRGHVVTPEALLDEEKLERWEIKAERAADAY
jgi:hypothetical protein